MFADELTEAMNLFEEERKLLERSGRGASAMTIGIAMQSVKEALMNAYPESDPGVVDGIVTHHIGAMMRELRGKVAKKQGNTQWGLKAKDYAKAR